MKTEEEFPPLPVVFYDWSDEEKEMIQYKGDHDNIENRQKHKLYHIWMLWSMHCSSEEFLRLMEKEAVTDDERRYKRCIYTIFDKMAKILTNTDILEELRS